MNFYLNMNQNISTTYRFTEALSLLELLITRALRHVASPGPVYSTVSGEQASRIVALPASVSNGSGKR